MADRPGAAKRLYFGHYRSTLWGSTRARWHRCGLRDDKGHDDGYRLTATTHSWSIPEFWVIGFGLIQQSFQVFPAHENYVVILQGLLEFGAGDRVIVALSPSGTVLRMVGHHRLHFGVIVAEVN